MSKQMSKQPPMGSNRSDDFQTPPWVLDYILPYIPKDRIIWECASGNGNLSNAMSKAGYDVVSTDITGGQDFLRTRDCENSNVVILTNPPYSLKTEFLERAYSMNLPFAFLLPLTALEGIKRQELYRERGLQIIFLPRRVNFETPSGKGTGSWCATAWFTSGLKLPQDMIFSK
jgi:hypothetical protein